VRGFRTIFARELAALFLSPLAWILLGATFLYDAFFFLYALERGTGGEVNGALLYMHEGPFWLLVVILPPLLTMRMISEEARSGMLEFVLTAPVGDASVVVGKALAATTFMALAAAVPQLFGLLVTLLGASPDWGQLAAQWLGAVLVSGLFCALGILSSASSGTPLVAAFLAIVANIVLVFLPLLAPFLARGRLRGLVGWMLEKLSIQEHFRGSFLTGALDSAHVVFFLAWILALLFLSVRRVETKRWLP
jgi:ABC-2 type transport system permease protein